MITAPFDALYAGDSGTATIPISDPSVTIFPPPCAFMKGMTAFTNVYMPFTLVVNTASHSSSASCSIGMTLVMPALQTRMSIAP